MTDKIIIGQITDLHARIALPGSAHIVLRRSRDIPKLLEKALQKFKSEAIDLLVVSGDILDVPSCLLEPNDYYDYQLEKLEKQTLEDYRFIKEALDNTEIPYVVVPGNHDLERLMWQVFDEKENEITINNYRVIRFCDREIGNQSHRLDRERQLMEKVLSEKDALPQIHIQHYPIHPDLNEGYTHSYFDAHDIRDRIVKSKKVKLSLSGHYHHGTDLLDIEGTTFSTGPAVTEKPHPIRIYTIENDEITVKTINLKEKPTHHNKPVAFLDRDGVINTLDAYRTGPDLLELTNNAAQAIENLHKAGYVVVVITSQSCVGHGYVMKDTIFANHEYLCNLLRENGSALSQPDMFLFSTGAGEQAVHESLADSSNAKPATTLPDQALEILEAKREGSIFVGDNTGDIETGNNLGISSYLVQTGAGKQSADRLNEQNPKGLNYTVVDSLFTLSEMLLQKK